LSFLLCKYLVEKCYIYSVNHVSFVFRHGLRLMVPDFLDYFMLLNYYFE
jgi:hypothetical protein